MELIDDNDPDDIEFHLGEIIYESGEFKNAWGGIGSINDLPEGCL